MKRKELLDHLHLHGCMFMREGGNHTWYLNPAQNRRSSIPRHSEINDILAVKICKDLGVVSIKKR